MRRLLFLLLLWWGQAQAAEALVAVAAGFKPAMEPILQRFSAETGHQITVSYGAVGQLYAQIKHGAPFDLLLSADSLVPAKLADDGLGSGQQPYYLCQERAGALFHRSQPGG